MAKIMILAGEASGDLHGANLARALRELEPEIEIIGMGGSLMAAQGVKIAFDITKLSTVGFVEALKSIKTLKGILRQLTHLMEKEKPDAVVFIDYPGFNLEVAKVVKEKNIPSLYYFSPTAWAWGKGRAKKVANLISKVASVFPFEAEVYREAGANVEFVGHPLLDIVKTKMSQKESYQAWNLAAEKPIVGLLPGSRQQEINALLPVMLESARKIKEKNSHVQFILPLAHTIAREQVEEMIAQSGLAVQIIDGHSYEVMNVSSLVIVSSGTATLEAACLGTPMVIIYKVAASTWFLGKMLVKIPHIGLPNIIAKKEIVPELLQNEANADNISAKVNQLLAHPEQLSMIKADLAEVKKQLGEEGAVKKVAQLVLDLGREK